MWNFYIEILAPWRSPIIFTNEQWQRANEIKRNVENDENIFPNKKLRYRFSLLRFEKMIIVYFQNLILKKGLSNPFNVR